MSDRAVRAGAWIYTRRTARRALPAPAIPAPGPVDLGAVGVVWRPLDRGPRGFVHAWRQGRAMVVDFRPTAGRITTAAQRLPWFASLVIPGAFAVKFILPVVRWSAWIAVSFLVVLPLTVAVGLALTVTDWALVKPVVVALVAAGWTPPTVIHRGLDDLADIVDLVAAADVDTRPGTPIDADFEDLFDPRAREMRLLERQVEAQEEANRVQARSADAIGRLADHDPQSAPTLPPAQPVLVRQRGPVAAGLRALGAGVAVVAVGIGVVFWVGAWALSIGGLVTPGRVPAPPTNAELLDHIEANHTRRSVQAWDDFCAIPEVDCAPTNYDTTTTEAGR